ncbi:MAG: MarR family winged helix-turn-helix transcriptional regulator, partial [Faecalibacillus intestinalis]
VFQRDLEEEFSIRRSTATGILQLMEKNDLIIRQPVSYDARLKKLVLTKKASEIQNEIHKEIEKHDKKVREGITEEELEVFFNVMKKIKKNLSE